MLTDDLMLVMPVALVLYSRENGKKHSKEFRIVAKIANHAHAGIAHRAPSHTRIVSLGEPEIN